MDETLMQHGVDWNGQDVAGMIATEKYRGCRAYWDGQDLWSRGGMKLDIPATWREALPVNIHLDGEVYDGWDGESRCMVAMRYGRISPSMRFIVFDCPSVTGPYLDRLSFARAFASGPISVVSHSVVNTWEECLTLFKQIVSHKGEGLMLRHPELTYTYGRTQAMLKVKQLLVVRHG